MLQSRRRKIANRMNKHCDYLGLTAKDHGHSDQRHCVSVESVAKDHIQSNHRHCDSADSPAKDHRHVKIQSTIMLRVAGFTSRDAEIFVV